MAVKSGKGNSGKASKATSEKKHVQETFSTADIEKLRNEIIESPKNYNKIVKLQTLLEKSIKDVDSLTSSSGLKVHRSLLFNLTKIYLYLVSKKILKVQKTQNEKEQIVSKWLIAKYEGFQRCIFEIWNMTNDSDKLATLKLDGLEHLMNLLKQESKYMRPSDDESYFPSTTYRKIIFELLRSGVKSKILSDGTIDDYLLLEFQEYFNKYWDLKFYFFQEFPVVVKMIRDEDIEHYIAFSKLITLIKLEPLYETENKDEITEKSIFVYRVPENMVYSVNQLHINFEKSLISALNFPNLQKEEYLSILSILHKRIIPFFSDTTKLMDFLTASYTLGIKSKDITMSILSLNGLWELMRVYNLDYPDFYKNLYAILTPDLLHLREKSRFFRLLDLFMSSTHLSASIVASFIKKLARLSLTAPPSGIVSIIPFIYNLIKKYNHTTCMLLIHSTTTNEEDLVYEDPFDENERDPSLTNAIDSSIWELETMINHYHPNVSSLVKIFQQHFTKYSYNMEDFLDWNYSKLIDAEMDKKLKGEVGLEFEKWNKMFDDEGYLQDYLY